MKGKLNFVKDEYHLYDYSIEQDTEYDYILNINIDLEEKLENVLTNEEPIKQYINEQISFLKEYMADSIEDIYFLQKCNNNIKGLLQNIECIAFDIPLNDIIKYIQKNPNIIYKKIIIYEENNLNLYSLDKIKSACKNNTDNIYFQLLNNYKLINYNECRKTFNIIEEFVNKINSYDFSPLEKIMYIYDIVRNKVYIDVNADEDKSISRDLTSVLLGDKIVCLGYAHVFKSLLENLGIKSELIILENENHTSGHARNGIYIKDKKYNINGFYYFDATWNSRRKNDNNSYLLSYKYFAKTKEQMDELDQKKIKDIHMPYYTPYIAEELKEMLDNLKPEEIPKDFIKSINHMSRIIERKEILEYSYLIPISPLYGKIDKEKVVKKLDRISEYFDKPLSADILLKVLYNVRRQQYYDEPDKYQFSLNDFYKIIILSDWFFFATREELFINELLNSDTKIRIKKRELIKYSQNNNLDKNIECVRNAVKNRHTN